MYWWLHFINQFINRLSLLTQIFSLLNLFSNTSFQIMFQTVCSTNFIISYSFQLQKFTYITPLVMFFYRVSRQSKYGLKQIKRNIHLKKLCLSTLNTPTYNFKKVRTLDYTKSTSPLINLLFEMSPSTAKHKPSNATAQKVQLLVRNRCSQAWHTNMQST